MKKRLVFLWILGLLAACVSDEEPATLTWLPEPIAGDTLVVPLPFHPPSTHVTLHPSGLYEIVSFDTLMGDCGLQGRSAACARLFYRFPRFIDPMGQALRQSLNQTVTRYLYNGTRETTFGNYTPAPPAQFANDASYQWRIRKEVRVIRRDSIVSLQLESFEYTGGAHSIHDLTYLNFDAASGTPLTLNVLLSEEGREQLRDLAENRFRQKYGIDPGQSLQEAGYWFEEDRFYLPDNFFPGKDSLLFHYRLYEVAPYTLGEPSVAFSRQEVAQLSQGPLSW
ncbi:Protein of unknown function [Catalinimonas alkaloidigena]|uniref:Uncharacterized protein n=1 Tax=Catalinimonas alkaloidigena TaxID=1075417 RepID=A0A1G9QM26_9BACT|nr:DUF3298 and DUF4163 domain-containing protein [Catalinimonas alkaloidigena]SDM11930.1 Protein of unknown function [Catalinimonas alkaloidigena]